MKNEIKICKATRTILQYCLLWPPLSKELNPGNSYYYRILILILSTSVWFFCIVMHFIATLKSDLDLHVSEDASFIIVFCGLYYAIIIYASKQKDVAFLLRDLSYFDKFGVPPNFEETNKKLNLWSKLSYLYVTIGTCVYNLYRFFGRRKCEILAEKKDFYEICGLLSPFWVPAQVHRFSFMNYVIFGYTLICTQMFVKASLMISFNAMEISQHIILRINHLNKMFQECFDETSYENRKRNLLRCILYHSEILEFSSRLDKCFSAEMFSHITMTGAIFACIEKQFVETDSKVSATIHFGGWVLTLFIACIGGQNLISASEKIPEAIWFSKWYRAEKTLLKDLLFVLARSQRNLKITAGAFGVMSYTVFLSVLKMSYSMFCMLRS